MADLANTAQKWAVGIVGVFVLAVLASALLPLITTEFAANGALDNATSNGYTTFLGAVPTILIIVFIVALILGVIAMLKMGKHR
jgi:ABC-type arginine transport system permease subunit